MIFAGFLINQARDSGRAKFEHVVELKQRKATKTNRWLIRKMIGIAQVMFESRFESRHCHLIQAEDKFFGGGSGEDFVEEHFEIWLGNGFEAERRFPHFADTLANGRGVFGAKVRVVAERHFEFVERLAGDARGENLVKAFKGIMVALVASDAFFDREAGFHGLLYGADASKGGD